VRIADVARKHGILSDEDILHAVRNEMYSATTNDDDLVMVVGPATTGNLLEIGILDRDGDDPVVIHAMNLRAKFQR
jgi:hypothetical protein